jgi:hypothetical protein
VGKKDLIIMHSGFSPPTYKLVASLANKKQEGALILYKTLREWGAGRFSQNTSAPLSLIMNYRRSLISAGSISLDSTCKVRRMQKLWKKQRSFYNVQAFGP